MKLFIFILFLIFCTIRSLGNNLSVDEEFKKLEESCKLLRQKTLRLKYIVNDIKYDNEKLAYRIRNLRQYMQDIEAYYRTENLEILGVPKVDGEDLLDILRNISGALDLPFNETEVSAVWRKNEVSGKNYYKRVETNNIVVRFVSRATRNRWLRKGRDKIVIYSKGCLPYLPESEIYINEYLTNEKKSLIKAAKQLEEEKKIPFAWLKDGHLYIRRTDAGKAMKIKSKHDLKVLGLLDKANFH